MNAIKPAADAQTSVQAATKKTDVNSLLVSQRKQIELALPKHMSPDRMLRIALTEVRKNPELGLCDPYSFLGAVIQAAQLGLEPGSGLGHAFLIPFRNNKKGTKEVNMITGYKGLVDLARRSGQVSTLVARLVNAKDKFEFCYGDDEYIKHTPSADADPGPITWVYAIAKMKDGGVQREVWPLARVEAHRDRFSKGNPVWTSDFGEMAKKTLVRAICKYLPLSPEMAIALDKDDAAATGDSQKNWEVLDVDYKPASSLPPVFDDEGKHTSPAEKSQSEADHANAVKEFMREAAAVVKRGGDAANVSGVMNEDELKSMTSDKICAAADRLKSWKT